MRILLTNDDGFDSEGLQAVADLFKDGHDVTVVAPDNQKSAASHSITLPPRVLPYREIAGRDYKTYAVDGSPADCVKVAMTLLCKSPDLVISGINRGENLGSDIWYSGTVSAAAEAAYYGLRAIALSLDNKHADYQQYMRCARFVKKNLTALTAMDISPRTMLNINFPNAEPKGVKFVRMNTQRTFIDDYKYIDQTTIDPTGDRSSCDLDGETDEGYCLDGYITVTPLKLDRTDYVALDSIAGAKLEL